MNFTRKDELTVKKERLAKLFAEQEKFDNLMQTEYLQFTGRPQNPRQTELFKIKNEREMAFERLEVVLNKIAACRRGDESAAEYDLAELTERKKQLFEAINSLPDLGFTYEEWNALDDSSKKKRIGRPAVSLEQSIIRTRASVETLMQEITEIQGHSNMDDVYALANDTSFIEKKTGRPSFDALGAQDYQLKILREKIEYITSGQAQADIDEKLKSAKYSANGKRLGRSFEDPAVKLERLVSEEQRMVRMITRMEQKLEGVDLLNRQVKVNKDARNELRRLIKNGVEVEQNQASLIAVLDELQRLQGSIQRIDPTQARAKIAYVKPDLAVLAPVHEGVKTALVTRQEHAAPQAPQMNAGEIAAQQAMQARKNIQERSQAAVEAVRSEVESNREDANKSVQETRGMVARLMGHNAS